MVARCTVNPLSLISATSGGLNASLLESKLHDHDGFRARRVEAYDMHRLIPGDDGNCKIDEAARLMVNRDPLCSVLPMPMCVPQRSSSSAAQG
jgi:hypothetical protein